MVHSADIVISIEGEHGTRSVLDVALAIERPILPLPFGGGVSKGVWQEQREEIQKYFQIGARELEDFQNLQLTELNETQIREVAVRVCSRLMRGFMQGCFVIMRFSKESDPVFDQAISPALLALGFQPWRTDRSVPTGDVIKAICDGIRHSFFVIADTTGDRPNVMYEMGFAHATDKHVILLRRANPDGSMPPVPFDFQTHSILSYTDDPDDLRRRLEAAVAILSGKSAIV